MTMPRSIEAEGNNVEAATAAAAAELGVDGTQLDVEVLSEASRGILGFGGRKARVRATVRPVETDFLSAGRLNPEPESAPASLTRRESDAARSKGRDADVERRDVGDDEDSYQPEPVDDATVERARELLLETIRLSGIEATVSGRNDVDHVTLEIEGDTTGLLIGRKGQTLDSLEYVISRILGKEFGRTVHVTVDSQGYRGRRQETLEELARRMGEEARRKRRPVRLSDLSPRERRIVHLVLRQERGLTTKSSGEGHLRTLVIIPNSSRSRRETGA